MNKKTNVIYIFVVDRQINIKIVVRIGTANVVRRRGFSLIFPNNRRQYGKLRKKEKNDLYMGSKIYNNVTFAEFISTNGKHFIRTIFGN